jgi:membrane-associated phospholipid phosphatase
MPSTSTAAHAHARAAPIARSPRVGFDRLSRRARIAIALLVAALCLLAMAATWIFAALVPATHLRDATVLYRFTELERPRIDTVANGLLDLLSPLLYTVWALLILAVALLRQRPRTAVVLAVVLPAAPLSTELLKPLLAHPHATAWIGPASWPSGHATAAVTLVLCALLVAPRALRPAVAAAGCLFAAAVGVALLILAWHMPSDVLGGYLLAALCVSLAAAVLVAWEPLSESRRPRARRDPTVPPSPR